MAQEWIHNPKVGGSSPPPAISPSSATLHGPGCRHRPPLPDKFALNSPAGPLHARILASVAEYENEVRSERIRAGQAAARAKGITWGGSPEGRYLKVTRDQEKMIVKLVGKGEKIAVIARTTGLFRPMIYPEQRSRSS